MLQIAIEVKRERALGEICIALGLPLRLCVWGERSIEYWTAPAQKYAEVSDFERVFGFEGGPTEFGDYYGLDHIFDDAHPADPVALKKVVPVKREVLQAQIERHVRGATFVQRRASGASQRFSPRWDLVSKRKDVTAVASADRKQRVHAAFPGLNAGEFKRLSNNDIWYLDQQIDSLVSAPINDGKRVEGATLITAAQQIAAAQRSKGHRVGPESLLCRDRDSGRAMWLRSGEPINLYNVLGDNDTWHGLVKRGLIILDPAERDPTVPYRF